MFMAENEDLYDVLLISRSATAAEVRKSYQELARKVALRQPVVFLPCKHVTSIEVHACTH